MIYCVAFESLHLHLEDVALKIQVFIPANDSFKGVDLHFLFQKDHKCVKVPIEEVGEELFLLEVVQTLVKLHPWVELQENVLYFLLLWFLDYRLKGISASSQPLLVPLG